MYAVFEDGGRQYQASEGDTVLLDHRDMSEGEQIVLPRVLLVADGNDVRIGTPVVEGAEVLAQVECHEKGRKVLTMKYRARKNNRKLTGHRQKYTRVKIKGIKY